MRDLTSVAVLLLLVGCREESRPSPTTAQQASKQVGTDENTYNRRRDERHSKKVLYQFKSLSFKVSDEWRRARIDTPATKLALVVHDPPGSREVEDVESVIKLDVGVPVKGGALDSVKVMEQRFGGTTNAILDGAAYLTSNTSTTLDHPRFILTAFTGGRVYLLFIASKDAEAAQQACDSIVQSLVIQSE